VKLALASILGAIIGAATESPAISLDLNTFLYVLLTVIGALVSAGFIVTRRQRRMQDAEARRLNAEADKTEGDLVLTHAQYEGFIAEAAQRLQTMSEATLARMEKELAQSRAKIAELEAELERAKRERNDALAENRLREQELRAQIETLQERVADLERRLEAAGVNVSRRHSDTKGKRTRRGATGAKPPDPD
jgi:chromosome segregation ATPase